MLNKKFLKLITWYDTVIAESVVPTYHGIIREAKAFARTVLIISTIFRFDCNTESNTLATPRLRDNWNIEILEKKKIKYTHAKFVWAKFLGTW